MWIREKSTWQRWADWEWVPELTEPQLKELRAAVKKAFNVYLQRVTTQGEELYKVGENFQGKEMWTPIGFTYNDFVKQVINEVSPDFKVTFFNIRYFFHTIQLAAGTWESGPQQPFKRWPNTLYVKVEEHK